MKYKLKKILSLLKSIYKYNVLSHFKPLSPVEMQINVTYKCNSRCQMCQIWKMKPKNELKFFEWQKIMKDPIFTSIRRLIIAGGEPILHPQLIKLIGLFTTAMPKLNQLILVTNGFLTKKTIAKVKTLSVLCQNKNIQLNVSVSLDGFGRVHDSMRGINGAYIKTSKTILGLKSLAKHYKFYLSAGGVICRLNLYKIHKAEEWCKKNKISFNYQIIGFHKSYVNNLDKKKKLDFRKKDKKYLLSLLKKLSCKKKLTDIRSCLQANYWFDMLLMYQDGKFRTVPCPFVFDAFFIDSLGDVYYCLSEKAIGNFRKSNNISKIYYHPNNLVFRRRMVTSSCLKCHSGCLVSSGLVKNFKRFFWFYLTGR